MSFTGGSDCEGMIQNAGSADGIRNPYRILSDRNRTQVELRRNLGERIKKCRRRGINGIVRSDQ